MLIIKDEWGEVIWESDSEKSTVDFARRYMKDKNLLYIKVLKKSGMLHKIIK